MKDFYKGNIWKSLLTRRKNWKKGDHQLELITDKLLGLCRPVKTKGEKKFKMT